MDTQQEEQQQQLASESNTTEKPEGAADVLEVGSKGWVMNGPLLYSARVIQCNDKGGVLVHYEGWNAKWDEWIKAAGFLPDTEANQKLSQELKAKLKAGKSAAAAASKKRASTSSDAGDDGESNGTAASSAKKARVKPIKRAKSSASQQQQQPITRLPGEVEDFSLDATIRIPLTEDLKKRALKDFENVVKKQQACLLPSCTGKSPVSAIFEVYLDTKKGVQAEAFAQTMLVLERYFNLVFLNILLYPVERERFIAEEKQRCKEGKKWSNVCGSEYLLRFIIRLPYLLAGSALGEEEIKLLVAKVLDLVKYLTKHSSIIFVDEDDIATAAAAAGGL